MKYELYGIAIGVLAVEAACLVAVRLRSGLDGYASVAQERVPDIDFVQFIDNKTDMVEVLMSARIEACRCTVESEIVVAPR